ncbi:amidohydrolase family protein [Nocardia pseudobrasiliensis]|uniref:Aminocarboxymuconate-semialdehyde decarboxylase n=1 Tax=Nocardia pseudobrasiliensis TaxID=45979 RepID=A0A370IEA3_9NOCA|nr:amidohydrolase family protein [Nocardia pseudobrasiliensis]RDI69052.1 aminocarboxymuconate-semialdehyde decarboxylase [Nocardia pseudobrasiliensis]
MNAETTQHTGGPWRNAIDVHHHILPQSYFERLRDVGVREIVLPHVDRPVWSAEASLAMMDRHGIRAAVVSLWPGVPALDRDAAARFARESNQFLADFVAERPERFGAFAVLPFPHLDAVLAELEYCLDVLGLDGVGLITNYSGVYVGDRALDPFLAEAQRRSVPLFVHPALPPSSGQPDFGLPGSLYEFPFDTVRLAAQLLYNQTLERFPNLRMILSHGGGGISHYAGRLTYGPQISRCLADRLPADPIGDLRRLYLDVAMSGDPHSLAGLRSFADTGRLLVGTDFPLMPDTFSADDARSFLDHGNFTADERIRIDHLNAEDLFPRFKTSEKQSE